MRPFLTKQTQLFKTHMENCVQDVVSDASIDDVEDFNTSSMEHFHVCFTHKVSEAQLYESVNDGAGLQTQVYHS